MCLLPTICLLFIALQQATPPDLVNAVELQRGGRHWIDQPTEPPRSAEESEQCFRIEPGFRIQLVASEPHVFDPVAIDFDVRGRMFVAEYGDYPVGPKDPHVAPLSQVVLLEDVNADGRMDKRTVFAPHLKFCHSLMAFRDGILACTETEIVYLADTDADNVADVREVWFDGFIPAHPQMQIGCPRRGLDNWIYLTYGHGKVRCTRPGFESKEAVDIPRVDFRFHPETMEFSAWTGAGQFGNTIDSYGRRYFSSNRNPIMTDLLSMSLVSRNPLAGVAVGHHDVGPAGEKTQVFPAVTMKSNWLSHAGTHTSACGVTAYRGGLFGEESDRSVFVCEPVGHLVTRSIIETDGGSVTARRAQEKADFLTSTDTWFRPASLATGPDGALYLADMYRLWVEHPKFVPDDVAAKMDWRAGEDRGRIWRIVPDSIPPAAAVVAPESRDDLVEMLHDRNGWRRMLAQTRQIDSHTTSEQHALRKVLQLSTQSSEQSHRSEFAPLHALWTLHGMNCLTADDLLVAAQSPLSAVRRDAARLIAERSSPDRSLQAAAARLCSDMDGEVRMRAILAADVREDGDKKLVLRSVPQNMDNVWLQRAMLISFPEIAAEIATIVVAESRDIDAAGTRKEFLRSLALNVAARGELEQLKQLSLTIGGATESGLWWQTAMVRGLADGLPRGQNPAIPKSLAALLEAAPAELESSLTPIRAVVQAAAATAVDKSRADVDRVAAMGLMAHLPPEALTIALEALLVPGESTACQRAAIEAARHSGRSDLSQLIMARWDQLNPQARSAALDLLLLRKESVAALLSAMEKNQISSSAVSIDQRLILLQHPEESIRKSAATLFGGTVSANRKEVAEQYAKALDLKGDIARGEAVFTKTCSKCHRIGAVGNNVGPDISDTRARARDALLYDILDPNRRVDPQYTEYIVVTVDGRLLSGLLIAESSDSVTLRQPEGREQTILRGEIEELKTTSKSLMPEGIERDVSVEQMADVLEFLKAR